MKRYVFSRYWPNVRDWAIANKVAIQDIRHLSETSQLRSVVNVTIVTLTRPPYDFRQEAAARNITLEEG